MTSLLLASALALTTLPPTAKEIDALAGRAIDAWKIPGLALVIIHDDRIAHLGGYGFADTAAKTAVTPDTIFPLASCTKPFTATLLTTLVEERKIDWTDPVRKHLTDFKLKDPVANERVTLRDLLCHRTGLGEQSLLWYHSPLPLEKRISRLALLDPIDDFRANFHYQTTAFAASGLVAERAAKTPWDDLIESRLFKKLGMTSSTAVQPTGKNKLLAEPYKLKGGIATQVPRYTLDQPDPAGSIHSTARDLGPFLRMCLADGRLANGKSLVAPEIFRQLHEPAMPIPIGGLSAELNPETVQISYGMGWIIQDYRGKKMVLHGGAIDGFRAHLTFLPQLGLAIGVLSNLDSSLGNYALANAIVDRYLDAPPRDWNVTVKSVSDKEKHLDTERSNHLRTVVRQPGNKPPRPLADYAGDYDDPVLGRFTITLEKTGLVARINSMSTPLEHLKDETFLGDNPPFHDALFTFIARDGRIAELHAAERPFLRK